MDINIQIYMDLYTIFSIYTRLFRLYIDIFRYWSQNSTENKDEYHVYSSNKMNKMYILINTDILYLFNIKT